MLKIEPCNNFDIENWSLKDLEDVVYKYIEVSPVPEKKGPVQQDHSASEVEESNDEDEKKNKKQERLFLALFAFLAVEKLLRYFTKASNTCAGFDAAYNSSTNSAR